MTTPERKPCPFCGGTADLVVSDPDEGKPNVGQLSSCAVHCIACRAWGPSAPLKRPLDFAAAWALWNQRTSSPGTGVQKFLVEPSDPRAKWLCPGCDTHVSWFKPGVGSPPGDISFRHRTLQCQYQSEHSEMLRLMIERLPGRG